MSDENNANKNDKDFEVDSIECGDTLALDLAKAKSDYLYLRADFDNYRKAVIKERSELVKYGSERILVELLEVMDNFERALNTELTPETIALYKEGVELTRNEFKKTLEKFGVKEIACEGMAFDPALHEAISSEEAHSVAPGHITRVFKSAYKLHERIIRPAQVVVATEPKKT